MEIRFPSVGKSLPALKSDWGQKFGDADRAFSARRQMDGPQLLINPPEGDRSGGGAGLGLDGVKEKGLLSICPYLIRPIYFVPLKMIVSSSKSNRFVPFSKKYSFRPFFKTRTLH